MNEMVIRIGADEKIAVEETENGVRRVKYISPEDLDQCIRRSAEMKISSGLLPDGCLSYSEDDTGARYVTMLHRQERANTRQSMSIFLCRSWCSVFTSKRMGRFGA